MYISCWPCLSPASFWRNPARAMPYPLDAERSRYFYVARNGIYHLFRSLKFQPGQVALVPDYHSGNEVAAIRAAGVPIRFYPIGRDFQPDLEALEKLCDGRARVLYVIHFAGWPQPLDALHELARRRGMVVVEDCALALLSEDQEGPLGLRGDYSIYCLYKTLPLPNGGLLVQNRPSPNNVVNIPVRDCGAVTVAGRTAELMLEWLRSRQPLAGGLLAGAKRLTGQALSALNVRRARVGNIGFELGDVHLGMSPLCRKLLARFDYAEIRRRRRANYLFLAERLANEVGWEAMPLPEGTCPLFFPVLVADKAQACRALRAAGIGAVEFWNEGDPAAGGPASADALFLRRHLLELPIHQDVSFRQLSWVATRFARLGLGEAMPARQMLARAVPVA